MFNWLVGKINETHGAGGAAGSNDTPKTVAFVGILDIFGGFFFVRELLVGSVGPMGGGGGLGEGCRGVSRWMYSCSTVSFRHAVIRRLGFESHLQWLVVVACVVARVSGTCKCQKQNPVFFLYSFVPYYIFFE